MVNSEDLFKKHLCDNSTVLFNIGLEYLGIQTNIKVTHYNFVTLVETLLTLGVDYTVDTDNDTITTTSTYPGDGVAATSDLLTITYSVPSTQKTDITANSNYDPEVLEEAYDHGVLLSKEVKEIAERAIRTAISDAGTVLPLPTISSGLEKYLWLNASGNFEWKTGTIPDSSTISAEDIPIVDTGSLYTASEVEAALAEAMTAIFSNLTEIDLLKAKIITSDNYLHGTIADSDIFDKLSPFIPDTGNIIVVSGIIAGLVVSKAIRNSSTIIQLSYGSSGAASEFTVNYDGVDTRIISLAW